MIIDIETTGPITRVWVAETDQDTAELAARDALGTAECPIDSIWWSEGKTWELMFETHNL